MKKRVLIFSDNPFGHSGIGAMCKHMCIQLLKQGFEVAVLAVMNSLPPGTGPNNIHKTEFGDIKVKITQSFADIPVLFDFMREIKPDLLLLSQDNHFYLELFKHTPAIRRDIPILFCAIWDTYLVPQPTGLYHYNLPHYGSVDAIGTVSHQTTTFVNNVLTKQEYGKKPIVNYIGLGRDPELFKPLLESDYTELRKKLTGNKDYDFIAFWCGRNQHRKHASDAIEAWRLFNESLAPEQANKTLLVLHTQAVPGRGQEMVGTDLNAVCMALAPLQNIVLDCSPCPEPQLNQLYNIADVYINNSSSEGFGLCANEAALAGRPLILNPTGGLKDQICKDGCYALQNNRTIQGSPLTPYLYDDLVPIESIVNGFQYWYNINKDERNNRGLLNREHALANGLTSEAFSLKVVELVKTTLANFKPQPLFNLYA